MIINIDPVIKNFLSSEFKNKKLKLLCFILMGFISSILEVVGIGLVFPFIYILVKPDALQQTNGIAWIVKALHIQNATQFNIALCIVIGIVIAFKTGYLILFQYFQKRVLTAWKTTLSTRMMAVYLYSPYDLHMKKSSSEIISNVALTPLIYDQYIMSIFNISIGLLISLGIAGLLFIVLPFLATFATAAIGIAVAFLHRIMKKKFTLIGIEANKIYQQNQRILTQSLGAIRDTKMYGRENFFLKNFRKIQESKFNNEQIYNFFSVLPVLIIEAWIMVSIMALVLVFLYKNDHARALATLTVLIACMFRMLPQINKILTGLRLINNSSDILKSIATELDQHEKNTYVPSVEVAEDKLPFNQNIILKNVTYRYPQKEIRSNALQNISLEINKNELIGITGPSGAGKSTLLHLFLGLIDPVEGEIFIDNIPLKDPAIKRKWQNNIGYVPQSFYLIEDTILNNIAYGIEKEKINIANVIQALQWAKLQEFINTLDKGIYHFIGESGSKLSGGQRQRIAIARALYNNPDILAFDEATAGLDAMIENEILNGIKNLKGKKNIIMIAHHLDTLKFCDRILILDQGKLIDQGSFDELNERCSLFQNLVKTARSQQRESDQEIVLELG